MSMYDASDPRSALNAPAKSGAKPATEFAAAEYAKFYQTEPQESDSNGQHLVRARTEFHHRLHGGRSRARPSPQGPDRRICRAAARRADHRRDHGRRREEIDRRLYGDLRSAGRQQRDLAEGRAARAHVHHALGRSRGEVLERRRPMPSRIRTFRRSRPGRSRRAATRSAATASTCRRRKAASAASSAAPPSW